MLITSIPSAALGFTPTGLGAVARTRVDTSPLMMDTSPLMMDQLSPETWLTAAAVTLGGGATFFLSGKPLAKSSSTGGSAESERIAMLKSEGAQTVARREDIAAAYLLKLETAQDLMGKVVPVPVDTVFESFDKDNSGSLDMDELTEAFAAAGRPSDAKTVREAMEALDTNGDGVIDLKEFKAAPRELAWWEKVY